eukprot:UN31484
MSGNLKGMLEHFGLTFKGREHSGLHDARNILRIVKKLMASEWYKNRPFDWESMKELDERHRRQLHKRTGDWICPSSDCGELNFNIRDSCFRCTRKRPPNLPFYQKPQRRNNYVSNY